jgi:hypothetical protein
MMVAMHERESTFDSYRKRPRNCLTSPLDVVCSATHAPL